MRFTRFVHFPTRLPLKLFGKLFWMTTLPLLLTAPVSAKPRAKATRTQIVPAQTAQTQAIRRQFDAKDATIADLRRQIRALTGQVAALQARVDDMWPADTSGLTVLTKQVQDYNRLLDAARADAVEAQKSHALQQAVGASASADGQRFAAKEDDAVAAMKTSLLQAQALYRKITMSAQYEGHFYETDPAVKVGEAPHALTFETVGDAVHLRFIQPR